MLTLDMMLGADSDADNYESPQALELHSLKCAAFSTFIRKFYHLTLLKRLPKSLKEIIEIYGTHY